MARITLNTKVTDPSDLAKHLRSLATKIDADALTPGAEVVIGNTRIQVAETQESPVRAFARERGIPVGSRGRFSRELLDAFAKHEARSQASKDAAAKRRAARAEAVNA